jgi:uncharacterized alkaline shock family protein YloU
MAEKKERKKEGQIIQAGGKVSIAEEVIASIAGLAALGVEGLSKMKGGVGEGFAGIFGKHKGVETELTDDSVKVKLRIAVRYGYPIHEVAQNVQRKVTEEVENMTGLKVSGVDIYVQKLQLPEEEEKEEKEEEIE